MSVCVCVFSQYLKQTSSTKVTVSGACSQRKVARLRDVTKDEGKKRYRVLHISVSMGLVFFPQSPTIERGSCTLATGSPPRGEEKEKNK